MLQQSENKSVWLSCHSKSCFTESNSFLFHKMVFFLLRLLHSFSSLESLPPYLSWANSRTFGCLVIVPVPSSPVQLEVTVSHLTNTSLTSLASIRLQCQEVCLETGSFSPPSHQSSSPGSSLPGTKKRKMDKESISLPYWSWYPLAINTLDAFKWSSNM